MTTVTVLHKLRYPDGQTPRVNSPAKVMLVGPGFVDADQAEIVTDSTIQTDATGLLTMVLTPNTEIDTENTYYEVDAGGETWAFLAPVSGSPVWLKDCLIADPQPGPAVVVGAAGPKGDTGAVGPTGPPGPVASVNGNIGAVVLAASDVGADTVGAAAAAQSTAVSTSAVASSILDTQARNYVKVYRVSQTVADTGSGGSQGRVFNTVAAAITQIGTDRAFGSGHDPGPMHRCAIVVDDCPTAPIASASVGLDLSTLAGAQSGLLNGNYSSLTTNGTTWVISFSGVVHNTGVLAGDSVVLAGFTPSGYNGTYTVASVTNTTITINNATTPGAVSIAGTVTRPLASGTITLNSLPSIIGGVPTSGTVMVPTNHGLIPISYAGISGNILTGAWCAISTLAGVATQSRTWTVQAGNAIFAYNEPAMAAGSGLSFIDLLSASGNAAAVHFVTLNATTLVTSSRECRISNLTITLHGDHYSTGMDTWVDVGNSSGVWGTVGVAHSVPRSVVLDGVVFNDYFSARVQSVAAVNLNEDSGCNYTLINPTFNTATQTQLVSVVSFSSTLPSFYIPAVTQFINPIVNNFVDLGVAQAAVGLVDSGKGSKNLRIWRGGSITIGTFSGSFQLAVSQSATATDVNVIDPTVITGGAGGSGYEIVGAGANSALVLWSVGSVPTAPNAGQSDNGRSYFLPNRIGIVRTRGPLVSANQVAGMVSAASTGRIYFVKVPIDAAMNIPTVGLFIGAFTTGNKIAAALYLDTGSDIPVNLISGSGSVTPSVGLNTLTVTSTRTLYPGMGFVWVGIGGFDSSTSTLTAASSSMISSMENVYYLDGVYAGSGQLPSTLTGGNLPTLLAAGSSCPAPLIKSQ